MVLLVKTTAISYMKDYQIRKFLKKKLQQAGVSKIEIERAANKIRLKLHTARPGLVIGKKGSEIQNLKKRSGEDD